ncbi:hypothetical protein [Tepidibacter aestuarii]|uniref:hypothetical protein n=1 Tax=Tepidibacter aestuarii TaxID=2925782 RepID=UPI0020BD89B5|nr:hypothetical protein [Tepidibacter aestuarii]CAH2211987.1 conserved membrane protein of unknown function [Tepidibacter aestuarii]
MSKKISFLGMLLGINQIMLFFSSIVPGNRLFFLGIASLPVALVIIEFGLKSGILFYIGSALLSLIIILDKVYLIPYIFFFGIYGVVKYLIEKDRNIVFEYILKLISCNVLLMAGYFIFRHVIFINLRINVVAFILPQVIFLVYDYAYGLFISYYYNKIKGNIKL